MKLTQANLAKLKLPAGKSEAIHFDDDLPGFGLRLREGGGRTWIVQYRFGRKQRRFTLGKVEVLGAERARQSARDTLAKVQLGTDPQATKVEARVTAGMTLGSEIERYLEQFAQKVEAGERRQSTLEQQTHHLRRLWAPLHGLGIDKVSRANVATQLEQIASNSGRISANRARASLSSFYTWAARKGMTESNPVDYTEKFDEKSRERVLTDGEMVEIWHASDPERLPRDQRDYAYIVRLLMLTAQRRGEVGGIAADELDQSNRLWTIPGERTKNGLTHTVPLSDAALELLEVRDLDCRYLFGRGEGAYSGWSKSKRVLDARILAARPPRAKPIDFHLHDIRRTIGTRMNDELGIEPHIVEAVLNHISSKESGKAGVSGTYNRAEYVAKKRQALDLWADHLAALVSGKRSKIVPISTRAKRAE